MIAYALCEAEYRELLDRSNQIEGFGFRRIEALVKLALRRQVPLPKLMDDWIQSPGVRSASSQSEFDRSSPKIF